jgi:acid stress-induced BolA-like protein IbaG/YrbA
MMLDSVSEHFADLRLVKKCKKLRKWFPHKSIQSTLLDPKLVVGSVSENFANFQRVKRCKTCVSGVNAPLRASKLWKWFRHKSIHAIRPKMMFRSVSEHFGDLRHVKKCKTCVSGLSALFLGTEVVKLVSRQKHLFHNIRPKMMFGRV